MSEELSEESFWKGMLKKHWPGFLIFLVACVGLIIGMFYILLIYIANSEIGGYGAWTLAEFSVGTAVLWCILLILWELLLAFLPFIGFCCLVGALYWYVILPEEDKEAIKARDRKDKKKKRKHHKSEGSGISFLFTLAFLIVVFVEGHWLIPIGTIPYTYWIHAFITGFIWICIIAGIPMAIYGIFYLFRKSK